MPIGIVWGVVATASRTPVPNAVCVLDTIIEGGETRRAGGLPITPVEPTTLARPPYGIAATTNSQGLYRLLYNWDGVNFGEQSGQCRFRVMAFQNSQQFRHIGSAAAIRGTLGLDLRPLLGAALPIGAFSAQESQSTWLNTIADRISAFRTTSTVARGMLGDRLSTDTHILTTRIDIRAT